MIKPVMVETVGDLITTLSEFDSSQPVRMMVLNGCGCCSDGHDPEKITVEIQDDMVQLW